MQKEVFGKLCNIPAITNSTIFAPSSIVIVLANLKLLLWVMKWKLTGEQNMLSQKYNRFIENAEKHSAGIPLLLMDMMLELLQRPSMKQKLQKVSQH